MLVGQRRRLVRLALAAVAAISFLLYVLLTDPTANQFLSANALSVARTRRKRPASVPLTPHQHPLHDGPALGAMSALIGPSGEIKDFSPPVSKQPAVSGLPVHTELFSMTTKNGNFFRIEMGLTMILNPNILPHPHQHDRWIVIAQRREKEEENAKVPVPQAPAPLFGRLRHSFQVVCTAAFVDDTLRCVGPNGHGAVEPDVLPIAPTLTTDPALCPEDIAYFSLNAGPHDARAFYGPDGPYTLYGSNSQYTCFGLWIQSLYALLPGFYDNDEAKKHGLGEARPHYKGEFAQGTEIQRPVRAFFRPVEKNWFLFWASDGTPWVHFDMVPSRAFALLRGDGSTDAGVATVHAHGDDECLARILPTPQVHNATEFSSLHQATNSLAVTLCRRTDRTCLPNDYNTVLMTIVQYKIYSGLDATYLPYVVLFRQVAPFVVWAASQRPIWIAGREVWPDGMGSQMIYVTSISWKERGQRYHGYLDDVLFLGFGINDRAAGGLDVMAGDLLANLKTCE